MNQQAETYQTRRPPTPEEKSLMDSVARYIEWRCRIAPIDNPDNIQRETVCVESVEQAQGMYAACGFALIDAEPVVAIAADAVA